MWEFSSIELLIIFLRLFLKSLGIYILLNLPLSPHIVLIASTLLVITEIYEFPAIRLSRRSPKYRTFIYSIIGVINNFIAIGLLWFIEELHGDFFLFVVATAISVSMAGGLIAGIISSLVAVTLLFLLTIHADLLYTTVGIRALFVLFIGTTVGILAELYYRQQQTLQKLHEDKTQEQRLQSVKEKFITAASHHLRTPITIIKGYAEIIGSPNKKPDDTQVAIKKMIRQIDELDGLIEKLIHVANVQKLHENLELKNQRLDLFLQNLTDPFRDTAQQKNVDFKCLWNPELEGQYIEFDAKQLTIALSNIISNAIKFTPTGGKIVIKTAQSSTQVFIIVSDTGVGIAAEDMKNLFSMFYQAGPTLSAKEGTGVGLFIANEIIKAHGGKITVQSKPNKGTTFTISLPKSSMHQLITEL